MGYLFENMEKIDIQEQRRKTEEQRRKAKQALIEICMEYGEEKEAIVVRLMEKLGISRKEAQEAVETFGK